MRVHAIQFSPAWEDRETNTARIEELLENARIAPGDLVVLPEMALTGFSLDTDQTLQDDERLDESFFSMLAVRHQCTVIAGVVGPANCPGTSVKAANEAIAFSPDATLLARYIKRQPFSLVGEDDVHAAGRQAVVFALNGFRVAPMICYDLRFPELARD